MIRRFFVIVSFLIFSLLLYPFETEAVQSSGQALVTPWSGYWWPSKNGGLSTGLDYRGHPAPLEKYLMLTTGSMSGDAIDWYNEHYYNPDAESWWGLCPAYARTAVKEAYPIFPSSHDNIVFRVGDKKGLLTLCHDDRSGIIYASGETPVDFHFWLLDYIGAQKKAFTADIDAGIEVWYHPIFAYEMESMQAGLTEDVTVTVYYADDKVLPDYMGTRQRQKQYTYELYLDADNSITGGKWTGNSISDHPETLAFPEDTGPLNPYLDYEKIREIAQASDDFLEKPDNEAVSLLPGTYNLVLLNKDVYIIDGRPGDVAMLKISRQDGSSQDVHIEITDGNDVLVHRQTLTQYGSDLQFTLDLENPPYTLEITQDEYKADPAIYRLVLDFKGAYVNQIPYIPKNGPWVGFSVTNGSDTEAAEIMLVTVDADRNPLQTVIGQKELLPGEKYLVQYSTLPIRKHENKMTDSLMLISDQPVDMVNLFASDSGPMAGFNGAAVSSSRLIFPDLHDNEPWDTQYMTGALLNESFMDVDVTCFVYSERGVLTQTVSQNILARGKFEIRPGSSPFFSLPDGGWMEMVADDQKAMLSGYQYLRNTSDQSNALETSYALSMASGMKYVQHVTPSAGPWQTFLTLINPNENNNLITIHPALRGSDSSADVQLMMTPFEKQVVDLSFHFGEPVQTGQARSMLEILGTYALAGYVAYAADNGDAAFYPLLDEDSFKTELIMPHAPNNNGRWYTGVGICNPNAYPVTVLVLPYDPKRQALNAAGIYIALDPGAYDVFTVHKMFSGLSSDISFLKIRCEMPDTSKIGGFYLYGNAPAQNLKPRKLVSGGNM